MARRIKGGWIWTDGHLLELAGEVGKDQSCGAVAGALNERHRDSYPGMNLTKDNILGVFDSPTLRTSLERICGAERFKELEALVRKPRLNGRPLGSKDRKPRAVRPKRVRTPARVLTPLTMQQAAAKLAHLRGLNK